MNIKHLLFPTAPKTVEVVVTRNTFAAGRELLAGQTVELPERQASELINAGAAANPAAEDAAAQQLANLNALLPPPVEPRPMPDAWAGLPKCFGDWWQLNQSAHCLIERRGQIWEKLLVMLQSYQSPDLRSIAWLPDPAMRRELVEVTAKIFADRAQTDLHTAEERHLRDAYKRAEQAVDDWRESNREAVQIALFHCSQHLQQHHGKLCREIRELHALGLEIFSARIAALGLAASKVQQLYSGSADYQKYNGITIPQLSDLKLAYSDENGPLFFVNVPPPTMACLIQGYSKTAAEVERLTAEAKKELARTRKATA